MPKRDGFFANLKKVAKARKTQLRLGLRSSNVVRCAQEQRQKHRRRVGAVVVPPRVLVEVALKPLTDTLW